MKPDTAISKKSRRGTLGGLKIVHPFIKLILYLTQGFPDRY
jgi:hypothetical protein